MDDVSKQRVSLLGVIARSLRRETRVAWPLLRASADPGARRRQLISLKPQRATSYALD